MFNSNPQACDERTRAFEQAEADDAARRCDDDAAARMAAVPECRSFAGHFSAMSDEMVIALLELADDGSPDLPYRSPEERERYMGEAADEILRRIDRRPAAGARVA